MIYTRFRCWWVFSVVVKFLNGDSYDDHKKNLVFRKVFLKIYLIYNRNFFGMFKFSLLSFLRSQIHLDSFLQSLLFLLQTCICFAYISIKTHHGNFVLHNFAYFSRWRRNLRKGLYHRFVYICPSPVKLWLCAGPPWQSGTRPTVWPEHTPNIFGLCSGLRIKIIKLAQTHVQASLESMARLPPIKFDDFFLPPLWKL